MGLGKQVTATKTNGAPPASTTTPPSRRGGGRLTRESAIVAGGQVAAGLGSFAAVGVLTQRLSPEAYGEVALALTLSALMNLVVFPFLAAGGGRFLGAASMEGSAPGVLAALRHLALPVGGVTCGAGAVLWLSAAAWRPSAQALAGTATAFALAVGAATVLDALQSSRRQRLAVAVFSAAQQWGRVCGALLLIHLVGPASAAAVGGMALGAAGIALAQLRASGLADEPYDRDADTREAWRVRLVNYAWPIVAWGPAYWLQSASDRWALEAFRGSSSVGQYAAAYQLAYLPLLLVGNVMLQTLQPLVFAGAGLGGVFREREGKLPPSSILGIVAASLGAAWALILALGKPLIARLLDERYAAALDLMPALALACGFFLGAQAAALPVMATVGTRPLLRSRVIASLLGMAFNIVAAMRWGASAVAWAMVAFSALLWAWTEWVRRDVHRAPGCGAPGGASAPSP